MIHMQVWIKVHVCLPGGMREYGLDGIPRIAFSRSRILDRWWWLAALITRSAKKKMQQEYTSMWSKHALLRKPDVCRFGCVGKRNASIWSRHLVLLRRNSSSHLMMRLNICLWCYNTRLKMLLQSSLRIFIGSFEGKYSNDVLSTGVLLVAIWVHVCSSLSR